MLSGPLAGGVPTGATDTRGVQDVPPVSPLSDAVGAGACSLAAACRRKLKSRRFGRQTGRLVCRSSARLWLSGSGGGSDGGTDGAVTSDGGDVISVRPGSRAVFVSACQVSGRPA